MERKFWQAGLGLPAAIFAVTLLALIAVAINLLLQQNAQTYEEEINLSRAFYAADSGAGIALNTLFPPEEYPNYNTTAECAAGPRVYTFTIPGLNNCTASVTCFTEVVDSNNYATIESEGSCDGVARKVQVRTSY